MRTGIHVPHNKNVFSFKRNNFSKRVHERKVNLYASLCMYWRTHLETVYFIPVHTTVSYFIKSIFTTSKKKNTKSYFNDFKVLSYYVVPGKHFSKPYPFTVDDRNTRYGPMRSLTSGSGMAAASSMTTNSAWPSLCASDGWMYWKWKNSGVRITLFIRQNTVQSLL